jgi:hypothetical protein
VTRKHKYVLAVSAVGLIGLALYFIDPHTKGNSNLAVFRSVADGPGTGLGVWALAGSSNAFDSTTKFPRFFGLKGDIPVAGDFLGNGTVEIGVFRCPAPGRGVCQWYIDLNNNGHWDGNSGDALWNFGVTGDLPVVGDWTGSGVAKIGVMSCPPVTGTCTWYLDIGNRHTYDPATVGAYLFGLAGDKPAVGAWAHKSGVAQVDQIGVFRCPASGVCTWTVDSLGLTAHSTNGPVPAFSPSDAMFNFGLPGDLPVIGNWNARGEKRIGVFRGGQWLVDNNGNGAINPRVGKVFNFGLAGDQPVVGFWTLP